MDSYELKENIKGHLTQPNLTLAKFNQISTDMTYSQVVNIFGFDGTISSQAGNVKTYIWQQSNKIISIVFIDNKVSAKSQIGLSEGEQLSKTEEQSEIQQNPVVSMLIENYGNVQIELYPDMAPNTVANFIYLINNNYYDGRTFNRVVENMLIQCGMEPEEYCIKGEFEANGYTNNTLKFEKGTIRTSKG